MELDKKVFELSETKDRLKKREEEVRELRVNMNVQIKRVDTEYRGQIEDLKVQISKLKEQLSDLSSKLAT